MPHVAIEYAAISQEVKAKTKAEGMQVMAATLNEYGSGAWQTVNIDWDFDKKRRRFFFNALLARGWTTGQDINTQRRY